MKVFGITSVILLVVFFSSCQTNNDCVKVHLSEEDLEWFVSYKLNDTVIFTGQKSGIRDSFLVIRVGNYFTDCNKFEFGNYQYNFAKISLRPIKSGKVLNHEAGIQVEFSNDSQENSKKPSMKSFLVFDLSADFNEFNRLKSETISIGKKDYLVYHFNSENPVCNDFNGNSFEVESFYWNKEFGLLRYDKATGETFELLIE